MYQSWWRLKKRGSRHRSLDPLFFKWISIKEKRLWQGQHGNHQVELNWKKQSHWLFFWYSFQDVTPIAVTRTGDRPIIMAAGVRLRNFFPATFWSIFSHSSFPGAQILCSWYPRAMMTITPCSLIALIVRNDALRWQAWIFSYLVLFYGKAYVNYLLIK